MPPRGRDRQDDDELLSMANLYTELCGRCVRPKLERARVQLNIGKRVQPPNSRRTCRRLPCAGLIDASNGIVRRFEDLYRSFHFSIRFSRCACLAFVACFCFLCGLFVCCFVFVGPNTNFRQSFIALIYEHVYLVKYIFTKPCSSRALCCVDL